MTNSSNTGAPGSLDVQHELIEQLTWHWDNMMRPRIDGITDAEYLWEPIAGMWSMRPRRDAASSHPLGAGDIVMDYEPQVDPAPVTTIAWRICHLISVFDLRFNGHFGDGTLTYSNYMWPADAGQAMRLLDDSYARWIGALQAMRPERLAEPIGPTEGPFAEHPWAALIQHINREAIHHGAEIALLRDLYIRRGELTPR